MSASIWNVYDQALLKIGQKVFNFGTDTFKCALFTSASNVGSNTMSPATYAAVTNELSTANGYTVGGVAVAPVTWTNAAGVETFMVTNPAWTPTGGGITARFAVIYDVTTGDLICWCLLDTTPADVSVVSIAINAAGVFTLARA